MKARLFIPSHAAATDDIAPLAEYNIKKVNEVAERILDSCEMVSSDEVIARVFRSYGLTINIQQYVLVGSTVRSYLSWLKERGDVETVASDGMILWKRV